MKKLKAESALQIQKPVAEVFEAIVNPEHMTNYFVSKSSGKLNENDEVTWKFPEFMESFKVSNIKIETNKSISFVWDPKTVVTISLTSIDTNNTLVKVLEKGKELTDENLNWLVLNTSGWANFLASLKAYLEYGINLRKGAFEFMKNQF